MYVTVDVYSWKQGENGIRDDRVSIRKEDELTLLRVQTVTTQKGIPIYTGSRGYFIQSEWSGSDEGNTGHR